MNARAMSTVIEGLKYMQSHEWAKVDGDVATIGITDHAQAELGDVVYVELPEVGSTVTHKETFGVVESVKAASDVYSPVTGEVIAINEDLADAPGKARSIFTLVPIRPRSRGERRSLRTLPDVSLRPLHGFNPDTHRRLSTPSDAFQLHPDNDPR